MVNVIKTRADWKTVEFISKISNAEKINIPMLSISQVPSVTCTGTFVWHGFK